MTQNNNIPDRHESEAVPVEEAIDRISSCGLLTKRQAEAYVLRDIESVPRPETAEYMGISVNTLDDRIAEARNKIKEAKQTLEEVDEIRFRTFPDECSECGRTLPGQWTETEDGPICLECADIEIQTRE